MGVLRLGAQTGENVLLVVNRKDPISRQIGDYYKLRRSIPSANVCFLNGTSAEEISWDTYEQQVERPVGECVIKAGAGPIRRFGGLSYRPPVNLGIPSESK